MTPGTQQFLSALRLTKFGQVEQDKKQTVAWMNILDICWMFRYNLWGISSVCPFNISQLIDILFVLLFPVDPKTPWEGTGHPKSDPKLGRYGGIHRSSLNVGIIIAVMVCCPANKRSHHFVLLYVHGSQRIVDEMGIPWDHWQSIGMSMMNFIFIVTFIVG